MNIIAPIPHNDVYIKRRGLKKLPDYESLKNKFSCRICDIKINPPMIYI